MTITEMARAHVNNVAGQLSNMINQREKLNEEIAQVEQFLRAASEQVAEAEQGVVDLLHIEANSGREVSSKDVNPPEGDEE
jgi:hypothetical protein